MKNIIILVLLGLLFWMHQTEIAQFVQSKFNTQELEEKLESEPDLESLKASLLDLQKKALEKKEEGAEKLEEIKLAIQKTQEAINNFQEATKELQDSGGDLKEAVLGGS